MSKLNTTITVGAVSALMSFAASGAGITGPQGHMEESQWMEQRADREFAIAAQDCATLKSSNPNQFDPCMQQAEAARQNTIRSGGGETTAANQGGGTDKGTGIIDKVTDKVAQVTKAVTETLGFGGQTQQGGYQQGGQMPGQGGQTQQGGYQQGGQMPGQGGQTQQGGYTQGQGGQTQQGGYQQGGQMPAQGGQTQQWGYISPSQGGQVQQGGYTQGQGGQTQQGGYQQGGYTQGQGGQTQQSGYQQGGYTQGQGGQTQQGGYSPGQGGQIQQGAGQGGQGQGAQSAQHAYTPGHGGYVRGHGVLDPAEYAAAMAHREHSIRHQECETIKRADPQGYEHCLEQADAAMKQGG